VSEPWLDRLAKRQTRGQLLRRASVAAALTLPFARTAAAGVRRTSGCRVQQFTPTACQKGCFYSASREYTSRRDACASGGQTSVGVAGLADFLLFPFAAAHSVSSYLNSYTAASLARAACIDRALMQSKAKAYDCLQPNCPGFDPCEEGVGPCATCTGICCADANVVSGYSCCTLPPAGCCKTDGCHSGITECGGG
jgi:hypothetical protein